MSAVSTRRYPAPLGAPAQFTRRPSALQVRPDPTRTRWDPVRFTGPERSRADEEAEPSGAATEPDDVPDLPDPRAWAATLVRAAVEVLKGRRPAAQLVRWLESDLWRALSRRAQLGVQVGAAPRRPAPVRVARVHGCPISDTVWEGSVVIDDGERLRAVALRLEVLRGRWCATALSIG